MNELMGTLVTLGIFRLGFCYSLLVCHFLCTENSLLLTIPHQNLIKAILQVKCIESVKLDGSLYTGTTLICELCAL